MKFTPEQITVLDDLHNWLSSEEPAANFSAFAGCGKTTVISRFISQVIARDPDLSVTVLAPTHAALSQLYMRIKPATNLRFRTVSAALGQAPIESNSSSELVFATRGSSEISGLVVVDESSMLGEKDVEKLMSLSTKIVFLGDPAQLAPVKKKAGTAILANLTAQFTLSKIMRADNAIAAEATKARDIAQYIPQTSTDGSVICHNSETELAQAFYAKVTEEEPGSVVWITYTNEEVNQFNLKAHEIITGRAVLAPGDCVRLLKSSHLGKNNSVVRIATLEPSSNGCWLATTEPDSDESYTEAEAKFRTVEIATPDQYASVSAEMDQLVGLFKQDLGGKVEATRLEELRSITPVDYVYAMTAHKSQGSSIPYVFANSQRLHGKKSFYVAYSRASLELHCCSKKLASQKGALPEGDLWVHKASGNVLQGVASNSAASDVLEAIKSQFPELPAPTVSHLLCVTNKFHAGKSAKGWTLSF